MPLLSIIVNHNPDFKNQFEQFQNIIPQRQPIIITSTMQSIKVMVRMMVLVFLKASCHPIQTASASYTGSCHYHQSRALSCSCNSGNPKFLLGCSRQCSSLSFESQNTCQALWTAGGF